MARFLIVEDHPLFREALESAVCSANPDADILQATSIGEALEVLSSTHQIDLILLDLSMPGTTGLSGLVQIRNSFPKSPIVVVSSYEDPQIVSSAMAIGTPMKVPANPHRPVQKKTENRTRNGEIESAFPAIRGSR